MIVFIDKIIVDCDLRAVHSYRHSKEVAKLSSHQVVLYLNKKKTIARLIDCKKTCYTAYSGDGQEFSVDRLHELFRVGIGINLRSIDSSKPNRYKISNRKVTKKRKAYA